MYVGVPTDPPRGARRLTARSADPQGLGQPRGGEGSPPPPFGGGWGPPPPPYSPPNCRTPLGVTHWLAPAPVLLMAQGVGGTSNPLRPIGDEPPSLRWSETAPTTTHSKAQHRRQHPEYTAVVRQCCTAVAHRVRLTFADDHFGVPLKWIRTSCTGDRSFGWNVFCCGPSDSSRFHK